MQLRRLLRRDLAAAHGVERDPVAEEPLCDEEAGDQDQPERPEVAHQDRTEHHEQQPEQEHGEDHPGREAAVWQVAGAGHVSRG